MDNNDNSIKEVSNSNKSSGLLIIVISIIVLAGIIIGCYFIFLGDNKKVFANAINKTYKDVNDVIEKIDEVIPRENLLNNTFNINADIKVNSDLEDLSLLNNYTFNVNIGGDYAHKLLVMGADIKNKSKKILSANINYNNNAIYLESKELLNKVLLLQELDDSLFNIDDEVLDKLNFDYITAIEKLVKFSKDSIIETITNKDIITADETITINNKKHNVKSYTIVLEDDKLDNLVSKLQDKIINDEEFINKVAKILDVSIEEVKDVIKNNPMEGNRLEIVVYREGILDKYIGGKIIIDDMEVNILDDEDYKMITFGEDLSIIKENDTYTIDVSNLNDTVNNIVVKEVNDNKYDLTINMVDEEDVNCTLEKKSDNNILLTYKDDNTTVEINLTVTYGEKLDVIDTTKAVKVDDLTEKDQEELSSNLIKILQDIPELDSLLGM